MRISVTSSLLLLFLVTIGNIDARKSFGRSGSSHSWSSRSSPSRTSFGSSWFRPSARSPPRTSSYSNPPSRTRISLTPDKPSISSSTNNHKSSTRDFLANEGGGHQPRPVAGTGHIDHRPSAPFSPKTSPTATNNLQQNSFPKPSAPVLDNHGSPPMEKKTNVNTQSSAPWSNPYLGTKPQTGSATNIQQNRSPYTTNTAPYPIGNPSHPMPSLTGPQFGKPQPPITPQHVSPLNSGTHPMSGGAYGSSPYGNSPHAAPYPVQPSHPYPVGGAASPYGSSPYGHPQPAAPYPMQHPYPAGSPYAAPHYGQQGPAYPAPQPHYGQPYTPSHTNVVVVPGQQHDSGRGTGQIFKEALIYSGVNAAVNRIVSPGLFGSHSHSSSPVVYSDGSRVPASSSTTSTTNTHITYNNQYFSGVPGSNETLVGSVPEGNPAASPAGGNSTNYPAGGSPTNYPAGGNPANNPAGGNPANNPAGGNPANSPAGGNPPNYPAGGNPVNHPAGVPNAQPTIPVGVPTSYPAQTSSASASAANANANVNAGTPIGTGSNANPGVAAQPLVPQYRITDEDLWNLTESLFRKDEFNAFKLIRMNLQKRSVGENIVDEASKPLFFVHPAAYVMPTIQAIRSLYDNYELDSRVAETITREKRQEENVLLDVFLNTDVMAMAMQWLTNQYFVEPDDYERKDTLKRIWFDKFAGSTSGFERVFMAELFEGSALLGAQNWVYFDHEESSKRIDYMGYVNQTDLGDKASLLKVNLKMGGVVRPNATMLVGTSPELEMALYTTCFYARPNDLCPISLGGTKFNVLTHSFRYFSKDLLDLGLIIY